MIIGGPKNGKNVRITSYVNVKHRKFDCIIVKKIHKFIVNLCVKISQTNFIYQFYFIFIFFLPIFCPFIEIYLKTTKSFDKVISL